MSKVGSGMSALHRAGARVGRFVLVDLLGRGAQAVVWRANDQRLDREVALKLLSPGAQSTSVHQWLHEARAVSRLSHPNIVPVFEADEADGQPYLVFELVQGHTLADALRRSGALPERAAATLLLGVLEAL
ncbi:MAG TPA: protein kinase, partial [Burkholderiaceae bacterium]|nr:protein kinase [Burkholderiaceae bacterium]